MRLLSFILGALNSAVSRILAVNDILEAKFNAAVVFARANCRSVSIRFILGTGEAHIL